jgi:replicative DNA helicase
VDGVPFVLGALDQMMGGLARSDLVVLAGRPGMGKSALALHVGLANARQGRTVVIFSLEMSATQLASRAIALEAEVGSDALRRGKATGSDVDAARRAVASLAPLKLIFNQSAGIDTTAMRAEIKRLSAAGEIHLLIIDYLQLMEPPGWAENRVQAIAAITKALKSIAMEFDLPVLVLSQLNRGVEGRDDKRPQLADLRESGAIEQDADSVILIYRDAYYAQRQEASAVGEARERLQERLARHEGQAELIVAKNRHGATGTVIVGFDETLMRFHDLTTDHRYEPVEL